MNHRPSLRRPRRGPLGLSLLLALPAAHSPAAATTAAASETGPTELDGIVVTGEKVPRSLQDTAASVSVLTAEQLDARGLFRLQDVINRTANVSPMYGDRGFTIRGIANEAGAPNPLATIYIDGAALPSQVSDAGPTDVWDLAQVEVLRGPQSTIQGENALAGAIVLRSQDPTMNWSGRGRLLLADPGDRKVAVAGGGPLLHDELAFRVAVEDRSFEGFVRNPTRGGHEDARESTLTRAKLLWTPAGLEGLTARLSLLHDDREGPYMYTYARRDVPDYTDHRINTSDYPSATDLRTDLGTLEVEYVGTGAWSMTSATSFADSDAIRRFDTDLTERPEAYGDTDEAYRTTSQEFRLRYDGERLRGLVGLYGANRDTENLGINRTNVTTPVGTIAAVLQGNGLDSGTAAMIASLYAQALPVIPVDYASTAASESANRALFVDAEIDLAPRWQLLAGARYDRESYRFGSSATATFAGMLPDAAAFGPSLAPAISGINQAVLGLVQQANATTPETERDTTALLPKLGVRHAFTDDLSLSLVMQRGYRSGGSSFNIARGRSFGYEPEFTRNTELSLRSAWLDGRLTLNANAYYVDWRDKQALVRFGLNEYDYHTVNAGRAHLWGMELEVAHDVDEGFAWYASLGHSRTRYDRFEVEAGGSVEDLGGREFAYAPRWTLGLGAQWRFAHDWFASLGANYRGRVQPDVGSDARTLPSRTLVDGRIGREIGRWSAYLYGSNLLDRGYVMFDWSASSPNVILGDPRVIGVGLELAF